MFLSGSMSAILPAVGLLLAFTIVGSVIILQVRRNMKSPTKSISSFTLAQLQEMLDSGSITQTEFSKAKDAIIKQTRVSTPDIRNISTEEGSNTQSDQ